MILYQLIFSGPSVYYQPSFLPIFFPENCIKPNDLIQFHDNTETQFVVTCVDERSRVITLNPNLRYRNMVPFSPEMPAAPDLRIEYRAQNGDYLFENRQKINDFSSARQNPTGIELTCTRQISHNMQESELLKVSLITWYVKNNQAKTVIFQTVSVGLERGVGTASSGFFSALEEDEEGEENSEDVFSSSAHGFDSANTKTMHLEHEYVYREKSNTEIERTHARAPAPLPRSLPSLGEESPFYAMPREIQAASNGFMPLTTGLPSTATQAKPYPALHGATQSSRVTPTFAGFNPSTLPSWHDQPQAPERPRNVTKVVPTRKKYSAPSAGLGKIISIVFTGLAKEIGAKFSRSKSMSSF